MCDPPSGPVTCSVTRKQERETSKSIGHMIKFFHSIVVRSDQTGKHLALGYDVAKCMRHVRKPEIFLSGPSSTHDQSISTYY